MTLAASAALSLTTIEAMTAVARDLIEREVILLDEQRWDEWLSLYAEDCVYWVPAWRRDGQLTANPSRELSLIYYDSRAGLEDRIVRIQSGQSPAGEPAARTTHLVGNVQIDQSLSASFGPIHARASFVTHIFSPRENASSTCFGHYQVVLCPKDDAWQIQRKKVVLMNDYISTFLDIYCL